MSAAPRGPDPGRSGRDCVASRRTGRAGEVLGVFLRLGLTSFGGPVAHLGYFRDELVVRRRWLSDAAYADLVALCQVIPGPASSQVGFALGLMRAGWVGALAAFAGFTLPSALILMAAGAGAGALHGPAAMGALHGLKVAAVAVVAQAVTGMARTLCPDASRGAIAAAAVAALAILPGPAGMAGAIALGAFAGLLLRPGSAAPPAPPLPVRRSHGLAALALFALLLAVLPLAARHGPALQMIDGFYRAGALVFGGGHVVLPLLQAETVRPGVVTPEAFLTGYAAAQAVPGPLFTFAAWLGTVRQAPPNGLAGGLLALAAIFLPGFLLLIGTIPFWDRLRTARRARGMLSGANAAVVGILGSALYDPVFVTGIRGTGDLALAAGCFVALMQARVPPWAVVAAAATAGALRG